MEDKKRSAEMQRSINDIAIFDTHEHLMYEYERRSQPIDFFLFFKHYSSTDLISSGMDPRDCQKLQDPSASVEEKWKLFAPHWDNIKNTAYSRIITSALADLYDTHELTLDSVKEVTARMIENQNKNLYEEIIRKKANIEYMLNDLDVLQHHGITRTEPDADYFLPVFRPDLLFDINSIEKLNFIEEKYGQNIYGLKDFTNLVDKIFQQRKDRLYGLKIGCAYFRDITFEDVTSAQAEKSLLKVLNLNRFTSHSDSVWAKEVKPFQDFMYHYCIKKSISLGIPIQIHTGLLESDLNDIRNSDPAFLTGIIAKYRRARFDIFHSGYPYTDKLIAMVKMYSNCYFNMCWIADVSIKLYMDILDRLIEIIPANKIFGFGGDYMFLEGAYAAQKNARAAVAGVLLGRVADNYFTFDEAVSFAAKILSTNPKGLYIKR
ncbi:MAG: amidohydrolase family protein [Actinomycetota bacterium]